MPQQSSSSIPTVEFDPRTGKPLFTTEYYKGTEGQYKDYDEQGNPRQGSQQKISTTPARGTWLRNKLNTLYNDKKFKDASPEQQREWKGLAYDKWVQPYYKNILKIDAPSREGWLTGKVENFLQGQEGGPKSKITKLNEELRAHTLETSSEVVGGVLHNLAYVGRGIDYIGDKIDKLSGLNKERKDESVGKALDKAGSFFDKRTEELHQETVEVHGGQKEVSFRKDIPGNVASFGTSAMFFEATGGTKVVKALNVANPKTALLATQMAKASWNAAVAFGVWSASQGEKPEKILKSIESGAVLGPAAKLTQRKLFEPLTGVFKELFKWGGKETTKKIVEEIIKKVEPSSTTEGSVSAALSPETQKFVNVSAEKLNEYALTKFKRPYDKLPHIQKVHILNRMLATVADVAETVSKEGMPKQIIQAQAKEQDDLMAQIFTEAKASQEKIEQFIKENGVEPQAKKLLATLPHHNTTIDSAFRHITGRISFLKSQMRIASEEDLPGIKSALEEEYSLLKAKHEKVKGTVGGAAVDDPQVFKGDEYIITPNIDPHFHGFTEWQTDSFAHNVAQNAKAVALAKGQQQSFLANAISNSYIIGGNLAKEARSGSGLTKQLFHNQYGMVGGINYNFVKAYSLGEGSGIKGSEDLLMINYLGMRPNVVARVWNVPGGGQTLFLNAAEEASRKNIGIALIPFDESKSFYEKMGMKQVGSYMVMTKDQVKNLLREKGLLMMLLGAGISYGATKSEFAQGDYSVRGK